VQSLEQIAEGVRLATGFDIERLRIGRRDTFRVAARQLFCYYARAEGYTLNKIASYVYMDHATVLYSVRRIKDIKDVDMIIKDYIGKYEIMSRKKQIIELRAPEYGATVERETVTGFICPKCSGRGYLIDYGVKESRNVTCPGCGGSGRLQARVTIEWEAEAKN
jgi:hypothetical protein